MNEWIMHIGTSCPVDAEARVNVALCGADGLWLADQRAGDLSWDHTDESVKIEDLVVSHQIADSNKGYKMSKPQDQVNTEAVGRSECIVMVHSMLRSEICD